MKRRRFLQAAPIAAALVPQAATAQTPQAQSPQTPPVGRGGVGSGVGPGGGSTELPKLETTFPDEAGEPVAPKFFTATQFLTLRKLSEILMPARAGVPSAIDAKAPEFLDFLIGESPADRQQLYRTGLDKLKGLDDSNAAKLLAPLKQPWTYEAPKDPLANFLRTAKQDIRTATMNSREWVKSSAAAGPGGRRGFGGMGLYWNSLD